MERRTEEEATQAGQIKFLFKHNLSLNDTQQALLLRRTGRLVRGRRRVLRALRILKKAFSAKMRRWRRSDKQIMAMYIVMTPRKRRQFHICLHCRNDNRRPLDIRKKVSNLIYNQYIVTVSVTFPPFFIWWRRTTQPSCELWKIPIQHWNDIIHTYRVRLSINLERRTFALLEDLRWLISRHVC